MAELKTRGNKDLLNKMNSMSSKTQLGTLLRNTPNRLKGIIDIADSRQGGAVGSANILDEDGNAIVLPKGAIIEKVTFDTVTAMASTGGTGTIAVKAQSAGDLLAAVDADTKSGIFAGIPAGAAANMIKLTADRTLQYTIATEALISGKWHVFVDVILSTEVQ